MGLEEINYSGSHGLDIKLAAKASSSEIVSLIVYIV